jgi:putative NIF3 family GTP cyclohydrolase 1 type 2
MGITLFELERLLKELLPEGLKLEGDLYGWVEEPADKGDYIKKIAVAVDARKTPSDCEVLITHHKPYGRVEIPTFVVHTPLDRVEWGTSAAMAELLGLKNIQPLTQSGFGRIGHYDGGPLLEEVKELFGIYPFRYHIPRPPRKIAVFPGCGFLFEEVIKALREKGADLLLSGDLTYHTALRLRALGFGYIDIGHYTSEKPGVIRLAKKLHRLTPEGVDVEFIDWGEV